jgi:crossover junction endodeoxyribonuclease RuvC
MIILGIDPGTAATGYGVIKADGGSCEVKGWGCLRTSASQEKGERLHEIYRGIADLIAVHRPDVLALERLFFNRNVRTAMAVGEARGVIILAAHRGSVPVEEYTALQVKEVLSGYGRASKKEIQEMLMVLLSMDKRPTPDDASDALALALCHVIVNNLGIER